MSAEPREEPDYHEMLGMTPGLEDSRFYTLLTELLPYRAHPGGRADLEAWTAATAAIPGDGSSVSFLEWLSHAAPAFLEVMPAHPHYLHALGAGALEDLQRAFAPVLSALLIDVRLHSATDVPPVWARDNVAAAWSSRDSVNDPRHWHVYAAGGAAYYQGQSYPEFEALRACARDLFARGGHAAGADAAFHLWDVTGMLIADGEWGAVVDALSLAEELPRLHPRGLRMVQGYELLRQGPAGVRLGAARFLHRHPHPELIPALAGALMTETHRTVAAPLAVAVRAAGGEAAFDALLEVAVRAESAETRRLASRSLAYVASFDARPARITRLVVDRDPARRKAGATALSQARHGSVLDEGGILATAEESRGASPTAGPGRDVR